MFKTNSQNIVATDGSARESSAKITPCPNLEIKTPYGGLMKNFKISTYRNFDIKYSGN